MARKDVKKHSKNLDKQTKGAGPLNLGNNFPRNNKDPNSNNSKRIQIAKDNVDIKRGKLELAKLIVKQTDRKLNQKDRVIKLAEQRETRIGNDKLLKAQQRQEEYRQKRKEYIGKSIAGALESWKFKF